MRTRDKISPTNELQIPNIWLPVMLSPRGQSRQNRSQIFASVWPRSRCLIM